MGSKQILWLVLGLLLVALASTAIYKAWPILFPKAAVTAKADPNCDLRAGPCTISFAKGGNVTFSITPRAIPVIKPLTLGVEFGGLKVKSVEVDFSGTDMYMGFNRVTLHRVDINHFSGEARIPVCVRDAMEWEAKVMLHTDNGLFIAPYRFVTVKPGVSLPKSNDQ